MAPQKCKKNFQLLGLGPRWGKLQRSPDPSCSWCLVGRRWLHAQQLYPAFAWQDSGFDP